MRKTQKSGDDFKKDLCFLKINVAWYGLSFSEHFGMLSVNFDNFFLKKADLDLFSRPLGVWFTN